MITKEIGKIQSVSFGFGGYQDAMIGISFSLGGEAWGCGDFWGYWATERSESTQWTEVDRQVSLGKTVVRISKLLEDAKKIRVANLCNVPIEATFSDMKLVSWRILKEVI